MLLNDNPSFFLYFLIFFIFVNSPTFSIDQATSCHGCSHLSVGFSNNEATLSFFYVPHDFKQIAQHGKQKEENKWSLTPARKKRARRAFQRSIKRLRPDLIQSEIDWILTCIDPYNVFVNFLIKFIETFSHNIMILKRNMREKFVIFH